MKTRDGFQIYNAHPCGCYTVEITQEGLSARMCKDWVAWMWQQVKGNCWSIDSHVCFKMEVHV